MRLPSRVIGIAALMLVAGCAEEDTGPNVSGVETIAITSVKIFPSLDTMFIADTISASDRLQLNATAFGRTLTPLQVNRFIWQSSDISVIDVDSAGMVVPVSPGTAVVTASAGKVGRATIVVVPATVTVSITPGIDSILVDDPIVTSKDTVRFAARARDRNGNLVAGVTFSWQATGAAAGVDPSGRASAISLGTGNIAVTAAGHSALASIHVMPLVKSVQLTAPVTQVLAGDTVQLTAQAFDYRDAPIARTFTWTSSAPNVAQVSSTGRVIFSSTGSASFTARTAFRSSQSAVSALPRALLVADAGGDFNCGIAPLGRLYCWGLNHAGQLVPEPGGLDSVCFNDAGARDPGGNYLKPGPSSQCRLAPMQAAQGLEFAAVSAGGAFACGITIDGLLRCWGEGTVGQCGNGKTACGPTAQLATVSTERFASLSAGNTHACAPTHSDSWVIR
jgi:hypothetical protein